MFIWRVNRNYLLIIFKPILTCCSDFTDFFPCFLFFPLFSLIFSPLVYYMWIHLCSDTDLILVYFHLSVPLALSKGHARGSFYPLWYVCKHFSLFHFLFNTIANMFFLSVVGLKCMFQLCGKNILKQIWLRCLDAILQKVVLSNFSLVI